MERSTWRIIYTQPLEGAWNMAVDEAVLESVGSGAKPPTMRLFGWSPPCLSLGYAQPSSDVDYDRLSDAGYTFVRRPTGGRAILHTDEITYSIIAPLKEPRVAGSILESYRRLSEGLLETLNILKIPARAEKDSSNVTPKGTTGPVCFEVPSDYEITINGKKLIGSAQARRMAGVLQHGSLPLSGDLTRITRVLVYPDENTRLDAAKRLLQHATTAELIVGRVIHWAEAAEAFRVGFSEVLSIDFQENHLSGQELQRTAQLVKEKYGNPAWLKRI